MGGKMVYTMTLANSIIGVGVLAMPFCFQKCGIILAICLLALSNYMTRLCCYYLLKSSAICRRRSMEIIAFSIFGSSGKLMVELCIIGYLLGTCITYFVVVGDLGPQIIAKMFDLHQTHTLRSYVMIFVTISCIIPLGLLRNVDSLAAVCTASIGFYFCLVMKIMAESTERISTGDWTDNVDYWNWSGVLQCLPIFSMALSCQMQLFEVFENVSNISLDKMNDYVKSATNICTFVYILVGFFGYVAFSTKPFSGNILLNLSPSLASDAIKVGFVLSVACSFPLIIFPCRASLNSLLYRRGHADVAHYIPEHRFKLITISLVSLALVVGILIPSIELVIGFIGSTIGVAICIMFPASCFIKVCQKNSTEKLLAQSLLIFGFILMVLGTYANLNAIDEKNSGSFEETDNIVKHIDDSIEQPAMNLSKQVENILLSHDVTPSKLELTLKKLPDEIEPFPKVPEPNPVESKYHENPVEELKLIEHPDPKEDLSAPKAVEVKLIPLDADNGNQPIAKSEDSKKSNDINKEAIQKEEQEIEIEKKEQIADDSNSELKRLEETKKLLQEVKEMKDVLEKQNQETQQLVLQKFDEIVDKVEKIEKVQEEDNKKHEEEKAEKKLLGEQKAEEETVVQAVPLDKINVEDQKDKTASNIQPPNEVTNQTMNGPIISMLINKHANPVNLIPNNSRESNPKQGSKEDVVEHAAIQRDLLNVHEADQSAIIADDEISSAELLRQKRSVEFDEDCLKPVLNDESISLVSENRKVLPDTENLIGTPETWVNQSNGSQVSPNALPPYE
ncbi:hypothetical protein HA402_007745 [Bradysia odoriphaga]|nr:hypothetical protein HA402_007745 [Bradysia odoriphaga]